MRILLFPAYRHQVTAFHAPVQPGVASVYCAIVQQTRDGCEFYIKDFPELALDEDNLEAVCQPCHNAKRGNRPSWA